MYTVFMVFPSPRAWSKPWSSKNLVKSLVKKPGVSRPWPPSLKKKAFPSFLKVFTICLRVFTIFLKVFTIFLKVFTIFLKVLL